MQVQGGDCLNLRAGLVLERPLRDSCLIQELLLAFELQSEVVRDFRGTTCDTTTHATFSRGDGWMWLIERGLLGRDAE